MAKPETYWIFGYGSLMWRPGFEYVDRQFATVFGYHRSLCVKSHVHRGTPDRPGLVLGLDHGGACKGICYRVPGHSWKEVLAYLREREQANYAYRELRIPAYLDNNIKVMSLAYVADRSHRQYAGRMELEQACKLVEQGRGVSGANLEYIRNTHEQLEMLGLRNRQLKEIIQRLESEQPKVLG